MLRRFLLRLIRRTFVVLLLICLGCTAQSAPPDLSQIIERHIRAHYSLAPEVKVEIGSTRPSDIPNFDALTITFVNGAKRQNFDFLLSKDHKTLMRVTRMDLSEDPYAEIMKKIDVSGRPVRGSKDARVGI